MVWFYEAPFGQISRALMSFDGKKMYARTLNVGRMEQAAFLEKLNPSFKGALRESEGAGRLLPADTFMVVQ